MQSPDASAPAAPRAVARCLYFLKPFSIRVLFKTTYHKKKENASLASMALRHCSASGSGFGGCSVSRSKSSSAEPPWRARAARRLRATSPRPAAGTAVWRASYFRVFEVCLVVFRALVLVFPVLTAFWSTSSVRTFTKSGHGQLPRPVLDHAAQMD